MDARLRPVPDSGGLQLAGVVAAAAELSTCAARLAELINGSDEASPASEIGPRRTAQELRNLAAAASGIDATYRPASFSQDSRVAAQHDGVVAAIRDVFTDCEDTLAHLDTIVSRHARQGGITKSILRRRPSVKLDFRSPEVTFINQQVQMYLKTMSFAWLVLSWYVHPEGFAKFSLLEGHYDRLSLQDIDGNKRAAQMTKTDLRESMALSQGMENRFSTTPDARLVLTDNRRKRQTLDRFIRAADTLFLDVDARRASMESHGDRRHSLYQESIFSARSGTSSISEPIAERPVSLSKLSPLIGGGSPEDEADYDRMMLNRRLKLAEADMQNRQYKRAEAQLRKCVRDLGPDRPELIDVKMRLAVACFKQQKSDEAKLIVASLLEGQLSKEATLSIKHNLAELNLIESDMNAAEEIAQTVVRGRGILYGTDHILYHQSAKLLADIVTAMGDEDEARIYESYLPPDFVPTQSLWTLDDPVEKLVVPLELGSPTSPLKTPPEAHLAISTWPVEPEEKIVVTPEEAPQHRMSQASYAQEEKIVVTPDEAPKNHFGYASYPPEEKIVVSPEEMLFNRLSLASYPPEEKIAITSPTESTASDRRFSVSKRSAVESGKLLVKAASEGNADAAAALIAGGASVSEGDSMKWTGLMWAAWEGHDAVLHMLLDAGASAEQVDLDGRTALMLASTAGNVMAAETLLTKGAARINTRSNVGRTALMYAAAKGHEHVCRLLIAKGAVVGDKDNLGRTAVTHAKASKNSALVKFLKEKAKQKAKYKE